MDDFKKYIRGKKVTVMGLGILGSAVGDVEFLAKCGANLLVTDLKSRKELAVSLKRLKGYKNIKYVLGKHRLEDFSTKGRSVLGGKNCDLVLKAGGVPLDSPYIAAARRHGIQVEMSASLFARFSPATIIGVTGTRGKTTVTNLIYQILKRAGRRVYLAGNIQGVSTLSLLPRVTRGDFVVMELDSWRLQGFGESRISPHIAVFTTFMPDHLNYYKGSLRKYFEDKANIFKYQKKGDILILGIHCAGLVKRHYRKFAGKVAIPRPLDKNYKLIIPGEHNRYNAALAAAAARSLKIRESVIKSAVQNFRGVSGRLELVRTWRGIKIYNDTTATTPTATLTALRALGDGERKIILIMGGTDKGLSVRELIKEIPKYCKAVVMLPGTGTKKANKLISLLACKLYNAKSLAQAVSQSVKLAKSDDVILFSPAFASFGMFKNEYDRGEQFNKLIKALK